MTARDKAHEAVSRLDSVDADDKREPLFTVTRGNPTAEELTALTAVFMAHDAAADDSHAAPVRVPRVQSRRMRLGMKLRPGWGAWRRTRPES
ncbi:acyl-CoA carboxylase subunit epsilon [Kocuria carniphila]|uniref:acyl-CoA carboxylase subunit epsilon n=1 Tax=Kocuria carniphila TaxID=262208 RepID=UPI00101B9D88|nr:acyl-CoA carboxylase subunit epsilon [Kocuria carniphila]